MANGSGAPGCTNRSVQIGLRETGTNWVLDRLSLQLCLLAGKGGVQEPPHRARLNLKSCGPRAVFVGLSGICEPAAV